MNTPSLYGAIEAGGTKFICAVAHGIDQVLAATRIPTTTPTATLQAVLEFFAAQEATHGKFSGIGIASFGPLGLRKHTPDYGYILDTPKLQWSRTDLVSPFTERFHCPVAIDTDVNAAALAEARHGAGRGCDVVVYITVGTGIGGGVCIDGKPLHGSQHPEMGHIRVLRHAQDRDFEGACPFHGDCLEGLASGAAILARYGETLDALPPGHVATEIIGFYLGQLAVNVCLLLSPQKIIFGGGVMQHAGLLQEIQRVTGSLLNNYAGLGSSSAALQQLVVAPGLGDRAGINGALVLGLTALTGAATG
jgi:fructokinase